MTWTMPWLGEPMPCSGIPNSAQLSSSWRTWAAAISSRIGRSRGVVGIEWSAVATVWPGRRTREAALAQPGERLRAGDLVDEVEVDGEHGRGAGVLRDDVVVPDLRDDGARFGHRGLVLACVGWSVCSDGADSVPAGPGGGPEAIGAPMPHPLVLDRSVPLAQCHARLCAGYKERPTLGGHCSSATRPGGPDAFLGKSTNLRLVRLRLFLALVTMFAIPIVIAAPFIYGLASGMGTPLVVPTARDPGPRARPRRPDRLAGAPRPRARRAPRADPPDPRGRLRPRPRRGAARHPDRPRQPPRVPGGGRAAVVDGARGTAGRWRSRSSTSTTSSGSTTRAATRPATWSSARRRRPSPRTSAASRPRVPRRRRRVRAGPARHRRRAGARRSSAGCWRPASTARPAAGRPTPSRSRPASAPGPAGARDRESLYRQADAALYWSKRHGRTCVTIYDAARHEGPMAERPPRRAVGRGRPGRRDRGHPRGLPADLRPHDRRAARLRGPRPAAARQRVRGSGLACSRRPRRPAGPASWTSPVSARSWRRRRALRLPGLADGQPLAAHARARRLQRPRPAAHDRPLSGSTRARSSSS